MMVAFCLCSDEVERKRKREKFLKPNSTLVRRWNQIHTHTHTHTHKHTHTHTQHFYQDKPTLMHTLPELVDMKTGGLCVGKSIKVAKHFLASFYKKLFQVFGTCQMPQTPCREQQH